MIGRLADLLLEMTPRERRLLAILSGVVLPVAYVLLVLFPLFEARADARTALQEARATRDWVAEAARSYPRPTTARASAISATGLAGLEASLTTDGLWPRVSMLRDNGSDGVRVEFSAVPFAPFMTWLDGVEARNGYRPERFAITADPRPGLVTVALVLAPVP